MATNTVTPNANQASNIKEIRTRVKSVFDLDSKDYASLFKVGSFTPVGTMEDFVSRLGNDSALILQVVNEGLEEYAKRQLENKVRLATCHLGVARRDGDPAAPMSR